MISAAIDSVFNGSDDDTMQAVTVPKAWLRLVLLLTTDAVLWLDSNYEAAAVTSDQEAIIALGTQLATEGANA